MVVKKTDISYRKIPLDILKIFSALMVVLYHLGLLDIGFTPNQVYIPNVNKLCLSLCAMSVPMFFMVNGSLTLSQERPFSYHVRKSLKTGFLYVFWFGIIEGGVRVLNACNLLEYGLSTSLTVHLWFLRTLMILYLTSYVIKRFYTNKVFIGLVCIGLFVFPFTYNLVIVGARFFHIPILEELPRTGFFTMYSVLYFILGKFMFDRLNSLHKKPAYLAFEIISIITGWVLVNVEVTIMTNYDKKVFDGVNASFPTIGALLMAVGVYSVLNRIKVVHSEVLCRIISFFSRNIMGIYLIHLIVIEVIKMFYKEKIDILPAVFLASLVMVISAAIVEVLQKIPYVKKLFTI